MIVWNGIDQVPTDPRPAVATIGNFDGVHLGHQAILRRTVADARARGALSLLVTFDPHPTSVVAPSRAPHLLQTRRQKLDVLEACGLDAVLILRFDTAFSNLSPQAFATDFLVERLRVVSLHVGESFRFGHDRSGDIAVLCTLGSHLGFEVTGVPAVRVHGEAVSSSAIRRAVEEGDVDRARRMLGRPYAIEGEVVQGDGRGRTLDFPTANLAVDGNLIPHRGVYVTETKLLASRFPSVTNIGTRPTFGGGALIVETHLIDFDENIVGDRAEIGFLARLREEKRFPTPRELADQIARDRAAAVAYFQGGESTSR